MMGILIDSELTEPRAPRGSRRVDEGRWGYGAFGSHLTLTLRTTDIALRILVSHTRELRSGDPTVWQPTVQFEARVLASVQYVSAHSSTPPSRVPHVGRCADLHSDR